MDVETETVAILSASIPIQVGPYVNAIGSYVAAGYDEYTYPSASSSNEQYAKLLSWFNYFEEFQLVKQIVEYVPRFTEVIPFNSGDANESTIIGNNQILLFTDKEDVIVRDQNLQEYYQARMQNGAVKGSWTKTHSLLIDPYVGVSLQNVELGSAPGTGQTTVQDTMPMKFIPTKQVNSNVGTLDLAVYSGTSTLIQQPTPIMAGWKYYFFCPYVNRTATETFTYGHFCIKKMYQFRYPDTRAILGTPTLLVTEAQLAQEQDSNYQGATKHSLFKPMPTMITLKAEAYAKLSNKDIDTPLINETKKRKQAMDDLVTASSSQSTHGNKSRQSFY